MNIRLIIFDRSKWMNLPRPAIKIKSDHWSSFYNFRKPVDFAFHNAIHLGSKDSRFERAIRQ